MSDYIFNCFKEHVTTGLVCSLSVDATDVLTERRGQAPLPSLGLLRLVHINRLHPVHIYMRQMKRMINIKVHFSLLKF